MPDRPAARSAVLAPLALALGAVLVVLGLIVAVSVGPSGRVEVTHHVDAPGITILGEGVTRAGSSPVHVRASAASGQPLMLKTALPEDAAAMVGDARVTTISGVRFLPQALHVETSGTGQLPRTLNEDVVVGQVQGAPAEMDVALGRLPLAVVVLPGPAGEPREEAVDVSMIWSNAAWFWQAVAVTALGAALLAAGGLLGRRRNAGGGRTPTDVLPAARETARETAREEGRPEGAEPTSPADPARSREAGS